MTQAKPTIQYYAMPLYEDPTKRIAIAATSIKAVLELVGSADNVSSIGKAWGANVDRLESITEKEASKARYFAEFDQHGKPLSDGTFYLGSYSIS